MKKFLFLFALMLSGMAAAQDFRSRVTRGVDSTGGNGTDKFTIEIFGGDIHSVHVTGVDATGWTIVDDSNIFTPDWYGSNNGTGGFNWLAGSTGNTAPGEYKFSVPFGEGGQVHITSANISVDLADGSFIQTTAYVPEPSSWMIMIAGFGLTGAAMRRRRTRVVLA